jgi:hypothetical protein
MFKITLFYNAGMDENIYTQEIETCTNEEWLLKKKERMLDKWLKYMIDGLNVIQNENIRVDTKQYILKNVITHMNFYDSKNRSFSIDIKEIKDEDEVVL